MSQQNQLEPTGFTTRTIHAVHDARYDASVPPVYLASTFGTAGEDTTYMYQRGANPTRDNLQATLAALEGAEHAYAYPSGMAATAAALGVLEAGDTLLLGMPTYGGTYRFATTELTKRAVKTRFISDFTALSDEDFTPDVKAVFLETPTNPTLQVTDIAAIAELAHRHGALLIVDNTFPTPVNLRPIEWGADIVTHSTTKYMDGHATSVGGAIVDSGNFDWEAHADKFPGLTQPDESYHGLTYTKAFGKMAYMTKATAQLMRDLGSIQSPQNAFLLNLGLETLHLRVPRHCENAQKVAEWLEANPKVKWVNYCGLKSSKYYDLAQKYMPNGSCGVIAFGLNGTREEAIEFMDRLKFICIVTHVADARTCVLHPASHTHRQLTDEQLREAGVAPDLIRLSVGIENVNDIIADIEQALQ